MLFTFSIAGDWVSYVTDTQRTEYSCFPARQS